MKEKLAKIFVAVLFIGLGLYLLITGITDLTSKSDYVEAEIDMAGGNLIIIPCSIHEKILRLSIPSMG